MFLLNQWNVQKFSGHAKLYLLASLWFLFCSTIHFYIFHCNLNNEWCYLPDLALPNWFDLNNLFDVLRNFLGWIYFEPSTQVVFPSVKEKSKSTSKNDKKIDLKVPIESKNWNLISSALREIKSTRRFSMILTTF